VTSSSSAPPEASEEDLEPIRTFSFTTNYAKAVTSLDATGWATEVSLESLLEYLRNTGSSAAWFDRSDGVSELILSSSPDAWFEGGAAVPNQTS